MFGLQHDLTLQVQTQTNHVQTSNVVERKRKEAKVKFCLTCALTSAISWLFRRLLFFPSFIAFASRIFLTKLLTSRVNHDFFQGTPMFWVRRFERVAFLCQNLKSATLDQCLRQIAAGLNQFSLFNLLLLNTELREIRRTEMTVWLHSSYLQQ